VFLGHVIDQFHDDDGFADSRSPKESDLSALKEGLHEIDDLDPGLEHLHLRALILERRGLPVDRIIGFGFDRARMIYGLTDDIHHPSQGGFAHRHLDRSFEVDSLHPPG